MTIPNVITYRREGVAASKRKANLFIFILLFSEYRGPVFQESRDTFFGCSRLEKRIQNEQTKAKNLKTKVG